MKHGMRIRGAAGGTAQMGLLFALAVALSALEGLLPSLVPVPGIKPGLSNVVTMYCVFALGARKAFTLAALKALFVLLVRGVSGALLSLTGGLLSVTVMVVLATCLDARLSYGAVSMAGAIAHNLGQLAAASLLLRLPALWYYLPALAGSGVVMGLLTAALLRAVMPLLAPGAADGRDCEESS